MDEREIREKLKDCGIRLLRAGLVQGTWGNLSMRLDGQYMIVTPSGIDYRRLRPEDMVKVNIRSLQYEGELKATSEKGIHGGIYAARPEINAVIHTHSKYFFGSEVGLARYGLPGSEQLQKNTLDALGNNYGCILAAHGMVCAGKSLDEAFSLCRALEEYCRKYIESRYREGERSWN